jgi:hypothetical protein
MYYNTTGSNNTASGNQALYSNTTGHSNVSVGKSSMTASTTGTRNTGVGFYALASNITGSNNTALGYGSLDASTTASNNTAIGYSSLTMNTSGTNNTATGFQSLYNNTTGTDNTAFGHNALFNHTSTDGCTAIGKSALESNTNGVSNTALGYLAGNYVVSNTTGDQNTFLGALSHGPDADANNSIVIGYAVGGSNSTLTFGSGSTDTRCSHGSTTWSTPSDERYKKDITDATAGLGFIDSLRPITYNWKNEGDLPVTHASYVEGSTTPFNNSETQHGFIAQEVKATIDAHTEIKDGFDMWAEDADGRQRLGETALIPMLVKAIQELSAKVEALEAQLNT